MKASSLALSLLLTVPALADEPATSGLTPEVEKAFAPNVFVDPESGFRLPYRLAAPDSLGPEEKRPLLVFLHGYGERGDDNLRQLLHGGPVFASPEFRARRRAFVVAPQCPAGDQPGTEEGRLWTLRQPEGQPKVVDLEEPCTPQLAAVRALVDHLLATQPIDPDRVYLIGLSMGGHATWELTLREPGFWAAAVPVCGGGDHELAERLVDLPVWALHGDADPVVPVELSRLMIDGINDAGGRAVLTEFAGVGHDSWSPTFGNQLVWDWLFAQRR